MDPLGVCNFPEEMKTRKSKKLQRNIVYKEKRQHTGRIFREQISKISHFPTPITFLCTRILMKTKLLSSF